jgi:hypothetical protein
MSSTFVFFHIGPEIQYATLLVRSILATNPDAKIIQCTDIKTPKITGVTTTHIYSDNPEHLMTYRIRAFANLGLTTPAMYLDTDMLVKAPILTQRCLGHKNTMLCLREFDKNALHTGAQRGNDYPEHRGRPIGEVFPYIACTTITRDHRFWEDLNKIIGNLDERFHRWYGDQEAMRIWVKKQRYATDVGFLPESKFACLPERIFHRDSASILHFKGHTRKKIMTEQFEAIFVKA